MKSLDSVSKNNMRVVNSLITTGSRSWEYDDVSTSRFPFVASISGQKSLVIHDGYTIAVIKVREEVEDGIYFTYMFNKGRLFRTDVEPETTREISIRKTTIEIAEKVLNTSSDEVPYVNKGSVISGSPKSSDFKVYVILGHTEGRTYEVKAIEPSDDVLLANKNDLSILLSLGYLKIVNALDNITIRHCSAIGQRDMAIFSARDIKFGVLPMVPMNKTK